MWFIWRNAEIHHPSRHFLLSLYFEWPILLKFLIILSFFPLTKPLLSFLSLLYLNLLTNILSAHVPKLVHWTVVVCVRGQRLAFTKRPLRFQLTAAVALAMCGWETMYLLQLNPSLPLPIPCTGTVSQGQSTWHTLTHTQPHTYSPSLPTADNLFHEIRNQYGHEVVVRMRQDQGEMLAWHPNFLSWQPEHLI